ncbi:MAG TPA: hypothetical protein VI793_21655 [Anaerolineales bacterium]|nr:hypothetical protein [Anaerolineales bacterium]
MEFLHELSCANCGASIQADAIMDGVAACRYCGATFRVPASLTPEPALGDLLLGADFRDPELRGWKTFNPDQWELRPGSPAELWANFPASDRIHPILRTPGPIDDFDLGVSIRFIEGAYDYISAGFEVRANDDGDYVIQISAQGTFRVGWHNKLEWGGELVNWAEHPALRKELGADNRLRVMMRADLLRVYVNGVLATSLHDARFGFGFARLVIAPGTKSPVTAAFADLQLRETKPR